MSHLEENLDEDPGGAGGVVLVELDHAENPPLDRVWTSVVDNWRHFHAVPLLTSTHAPWTFYLCAAGGSRTWPHSWVFLPRAYNGWISCRSLDLTCLTDVLCCRCRQRYSGRARHMSWSPDVKLWIPFVLSIMCSREYLAKSLPHEPKELLISSLLSTTIDDHVTELRLLARLDLQFQQLMHL